MHLSIRRKLVLLVVIMTIGTVLALWLALQAFHQDMIEERRYQLKNVTQLMANELGVLYQEDSSNSTSAEQRLLRVREMIHSSRYSDTDYFFLYQRSGVVVAHAIDRTLEGRNLLTLQDTDGRYIVREMLTGVEASGSVYWTFKWPRPGEVNPVAKLGYAMEIPDTGLVVGTGLYLDTLAQAYRHRLVTTGSYLAVLLMVVLILALLLARSISRPIISLSRQMKRLAQGDLQQKIIATDRKDELGTMARSVRRFQHQGIENKRLQQVQEQTRFKTDFDPVTQLPNRQAISDAIDREVTRQSVSPEGFAVLCIRLGNLQQLAMEHGEHSRDQVLLHLTRRLFQVLNVGDVLARLSDDCLCLLLPGAASDEALAPVRDALLRNLRQPIDRLDQEFVLDCYLGGSLYPKSGDQGYQLLGQAEIAASAGLQTHQSWTAFDGLDTDAHDPHAALWRELQTAIEEDQFRLVMQPIYSLVTGQVASVEVLLRWRHPSRGFINPMSFIPQAEQNGMISRIDRWVLNAVAKQLRSWLDEGIELPRFAVNISGISFLRYDLPELACTTFEQYLVPMTYLEVELTEGVLIDELSTVSDQMERVRAMGATVAIDDFGTGYSSISRIRNLPIDKVKIDRAFIMDIESSKQDLQLVEAIVHMSHGLELSVVAEGVETRGQLEILRQAKCDLLQGYLMNRPMSPEEFVALLQRQNERRQQRASQDQPQNRSDDLLDDLVAE